MINVQINKDNIPSTTQEIQFATGKCQDRFERIKRTCSNITKHDAHSAQRQGSKITTQMNENFGIGA